MKGWTSPAFLVELLGMTDFCNLNCTYCDWEKRPAPSLAPDEQAKVREHLAKAAAFVREHVPRAQMVEYSGGEPFMYPEIVWEVLRAFPNHWVRIITNGLLVSEADLEALRVHGKAILAVSLDGHTPDLNRARFRTREQFQTVVTTIDRALETRIPVMLLCTLHPGNIDALPEYLRWVSERWGTYIEQGQLVLPAHKMSNYQTRRPLVTPEQWVRLQEALSGLDLPVCTRLREHYRAMFSRTRFCNIHRWCISLHFLNRSLALDGIFTSFRCGMRGIGLLGEFRIGADDGAFCEAMAQAEDYDFRALYCRCFVDWRAFDLIFDGSVPLDQAREWFVLFRDPAVVDWIHWYQQLPGNRKEAPTVLHAPFAGQIDAVFFDLYGTLLDLHPADPGYSRQWETLAQYLSYQKAPYSPPELFAAMGEERAGLLEELERERRPEREHDEAEVYRRLFRRKGEEADPEQIRTAALIYRITEVARCAAYPGAVDLLRALREQGKKVCLLSNAQALYTLPELEMTGLLDCFDAVRISSEQGLRKPSLAFFRELVQWTGIPPERILMVGNDAVHDILPARRLGMYTCYLHTNLSPTEDIPPCTFHLDGPDMEGLKKLLLNPD